MVNNLITYQPSNVVYRHGYAHVLTCNAHIRNKIKKNYYKILLKKTAELSQKALKRIIIYLHLYKVMQ
ncbi:MAG: hypothetical protein BGO70_12520 [Bacteroidetes bacterium 43-93]|nr:MAG: hypothetical protein BGO70_12520 [Bacteroidetes bacterium 43-93]